MSGWLRYFTLKAQVSTGFSSGIVVWAIIAIIAAIVAVIFFLVAAFVWLADRYDGLIAGLLLAGAFVLIALIAIVVCLASRRRNMERARLELAARSSDANWLDPKLVAMALQIVQAIGWRRLASLAAVGVLAAALSKEWIGQKNTQAADDEPSGES